MVYRELTGLINLENISKYYGEIVALTNFSHNFTKEKTSVIIGPSGCGKSTLIRLITGLTQPDKGNISIKSQKLTEADMTQLRLGMGYVIQEGGLFPHLDVKNNITIAANSIKWNSDDVDKRYSSLLHLTKLSNDFSDKYPHELSGGQRQRVSLMRSLMLDPGILLMDEPLGALDPLIRFDLQKDLKQIFTTLKKTVIMVTHDLTEALYFADEIILMNNGIIEQVGSPAELIDKPANSFVKRFIAAQRSLIE